ncbi:MAG: hypothetical protein AB7I27_13050 [Bacteriovoracaceae bacterium]
MKIYGPILLLILLTLIGCGQEQFGAVRQNSSSQANTLKTYEQLSCSSFTLIKPKVDILYVVDNSSSTYFLQSDIRNAIKNTVNSISTQFDYRVIGTSLLPVKDDPTPYNDYQVITNSSDALSSEAAGRKIISADELNFFNTPEPEGTEAGAKRVIDFISNNSSSGLFRQSAYLLVVLISNGRDQEIEYSPYSNGQTLQNIAIYNERLNSLKSIKTQLNLQQLRFFSVTANSSCNKTGWYSSEKSYISIAKDLYNLSGATDSNVNQDFYNLCTNSISSLFTGVNNSIQQVLIPHTYRYWPITFAENNEMVSINDIQVIKVSSNGSKTDLSKNAQWTYVDEGSAVSVNTRELPSLGEAVVGRHFVRFTDGNLITYPDCVIVKSISRTEYLGYVVIQKAPQVASVVLRVNGKVIPQSSTNGWTYIGYQTNKNIKMPYPNSGDDLPAIIKTGFMIQLNGSSNYYKSGDEITVDYFPAAL